MQALKPADRGGRIEVKGLSKHRITGVQQGIYVFVKSIDDSTGTLGYWRRVTTHRGNLTRG